MAFPDSMHALRMKRPSYFPPRPEEILNFESNIGLGEPISIKVRTVEGGVRRMSASPFFSKPYFTTSAGCLGAV